MPRPHAPAAHRTLCVFCSAEFVSRNIRRTYCYEESCVRTRKRQAATPGEPCSVCGRPSIGKGLCPTHYTEQWKQDNAERYTHTCTHCGIEFKTWRKQMGACSLTCQRRAALTRARAVPRRAMEPSTDLVTYRRPRVWLGSQTSGGRWVQGACNNCGTQFTAPASSGYCSARCRQRAKDARRAKVFGTFAVSDIVRVAIYKRDDFTCQLCRLPVDMTLQHNDRMSATLDHIEPQSRALIPDHSERNLRLAHRLCNSIRGDARQE